MAARNFQTPRTILPELVLIPGSFAPNGSSAISANSRKGPGWSVAYTSTGLYTITFTDKFTDLVSFLITPMLAAGDDKILQAGAFSQSAKTITIRCWDISAAAVADIAANADNRIQFLACFLNSSAVPLRGS